MNLKEAFPKYENVHLMQPRLDAINATVEDFVDKLIADNVLPIEIAESYYKVDYDRCVNYMNEFGWAWIVDKIADYYPYIQ